jgi:hypothetical protein
VSFSSELFQLLEAIGALTKEEKQKAKSRATSYQDAATESLDRTQDSQAASTEDADDTEFIKPASTIGSAVFKVRFQVSTFDYLVSTYFNLKAHKSSPGRLNPNHVFT